MATGQINGVGAGGGIPENRESRELAKLAWPNVRKVKLENGSQALMLVISPTEQHSTEKGILMLSIRETALIAAKANSAAGIENKALSIDALITDAGDRPRLMLLALKARGVTAVVFAGEQAAPATVSATPAAPQPSKNDLAAVSQNARKMYKMMRDSGITIAGLPEKLPESLSGSQIELIFRSFGVTGLGNTNYDNAREWLQNQGANVGLNMAGETRELSTGSLSVTPPPRKK